MNMQKKVLILKVLRIDQPITENTPTPGRFFCKDGGPPNGHPGRPFCKYGGPPNGHMAKTSETDQF